MAVIAVITHAAYLSTTLTNFLQRSSNQARKMSSPFHKRRKFPSPHFDSKREDSSAAAVARVQSDLCFGKREHRWQAGRIELAGTRRAALVSDISYTCVRQYMSI
jgi:hypothetical protein